jgi:hypothetical protein
MLRENKCERFWGVNIYGLMRRKILILKELMKYHKKFSKDLTNHTKSTAMSIFDRCKVSSRNRKRSW